ncbi:MAG: hypothetical protein R3B84_15865 [Zavarzinella sp.]
MTNEEILEILQTRLDAINKTIAQSCERSGRTPDQVLVVAVTKTVPARVVKLLHQLGVKHFGESRPQVLIQKAVAAE